MSEFCSAISQGCFSGVCIGIGFPCLAYTICARKLLWLAIGTFLIGLGLYLVDCTWMVTDYSYYWGIALGCIALRFANKKLRYLGVPLLLVYTGLVLTENTQIMQDAANYLLDTLTPKGSITLAKVIVRSFALFYLGCTGFCLYKFGGRLSKSNFLVAAGLFAYLTIVAYMVEC